MKNQQLTFIILLLLVFFFFTNCENRTNRINNGLKGKWILDSISYPEREYLKNEQGKWVEDCSSNYFTKKGKYHNSGQCQYLTFYDATNYEEYGVCGDVHTRFTGKYFILENSQRGLLTLTLIPDIIIDEKDTIRIGYSNMDIVSLNKSQLVLISETIWGASDCLPAVHFNKRYLYRKIK